MRREVNDDSVNGRRLCWSMSGWCGDVAKLWVCVVEMLCGGGVVLDCVLVVRCVIKVMGM